MELRPWNPADLIAHTRWLRALARQLVHDAAQVDDLVQETLLAALERRPDGGRSLKPWLRRVLRNRRALQARGDARRRAREEGRASQEALPSSAELLELAEVHARIAEALTRLRDPYRTALLLRYHEGLEPREIARQLGLPAATVRSQLKRGLDELRAELDRGCKGEQRAWVLALVPLAFEAPQSPPASRPDVPGQRVPKPGAPRLSSKGPKTLYQSLRAMNPTLQLLCASCALVLAGSYFSGQFAPSLPGGASGGAGARASAQASADPGVATRAEAAPRLATSSSLGAPLALAAGERIHGRVVNADTNEPLPGFELRIRESVADAVFESVCTDAVGAFETEATYEDGVELVLVLRDHEGLDQVERSARQSLPRLASLSRSAVWHLEDGTLELRARVGPTYALDVEAPFDWRATGLLASLEAREGEPYGLLDHSSQLRAPVRSEPDAWIRFCWPFIPLPTDRPWLLQLETPDGLWMGAAEVEAGSGSTSSAISIELAPSARVDVQLVSVEALTDAVVALEGLGAGPHRLLWPRGEVQREDGRHGYAFRLGGLAPGSYRLFASSEGVELPAADLELVGGEVHAREIELASPPAAASFRGELRSLSGQFQEPMGLSLANARGETWSLQLPSWEERDGAFCAPFAFGNLAPGDYWLHLSCLQSYYRWDLPAGPLALPLDELVVTCLDTEPTLTLELRVRDADTGEALLLSSGRLLPEGSATVWNAHGGGGRSFFSHVPLANPLEWWAFAPGYVPRFGDEAALSSEGQILVVDVALSRGWGARIDARRQADGEPLAGVEVRLDGELAGVTDALGRLLVSAPDAPTQVTLHRAGWQFAGGAFDPDSQTLSGYPPVYGVSFAELP